METLTPREAALSAENTRLRRLLAEAGLLADAAAAEASAVSSAHALMLAESRLETYVAQEATRQAHEVAGQAAAEHRGEMAAQHAESDRQRGLYADLRSSEGRLRLILESASNFAIFAIDLDGRVTEWNLGARNILGWDEAEYSNRTSGRSGRRRTRRQALQRTRCASCAR